MVFFCGSMWGQAKSDAFGWPTYGGDAGGQRYAAASQINRSNVSGLKPAWTFHTHALDSKRPGYRSAAFEATPLLFHDTLYFTTPFDDVIALEPRTGAQRWTYDPQIGHMAEGGLITSRGVATWESSTAVAGKLCESRIFVATLNGRLAAVDAANGQVCMDFGDHGQIHLRDGVDYKEEYEGYSLTSPPTVVGDVVVVGSSIADNVAVDMPRGTVRGFDVRTGRQIWAWEPIPWALTQKIRTGAANAWSVIAADPALGLIYIPTGSASPDYYGGMRPGDDRDADSVVAIEAATGKKVWAFQVIHHNVWDYDVAAEPLLFTFHKTIPAIAISSKPGMVFVLDRRTGQPLYPIEERAVPQSDVAGEQTSPTQPISSLPSFSPLTVPEDTKQGWQRSAENVSFCADRMKGVRYDGLYTPPSLRGTLLYPGPLGGVNWGSTALDPETGIIYANNNRLPYLVTLTARTATEGGAGSTNRQKITSRIHAAWISLMILHNPVVWYALAILVIVIAAVRRRSFSPGFLAVVVALGCVTFGLVLEKHYRDAVTADIHATFGTENGPNVRSPYLVNRTPLVDHDGMPCTAPPFGGLTAINLNTGEKIFEKVHGTLIAGQQTGSPSLGGPMVTGGGLLFTAGTKEPLIRAYDSATGAELWNGALPVPAQSTPMSYVSGGRQFVVIAAGGHGSFGTPQSDALIAFALQ